MQAIHFGAGNIDRGFIGALLVESGMDLTFVDINHQLVRSLQQEGGYELTIVGDSGMRVERVQGVRALHFDDTDAIVSLFDEVSLISFAVGVDNISHIAPLIALGIERRFHSGNRRNLNLIACENMIASTQKLKHEVVMRLPRQCHAFVEQHIGFVDSVIDRIVVSHQHNPLDILSVSLESFYQWSVDEQGFKGEIPQIIGMHKTDNLRAFAERKLFMFNSAHCITAVYGFLKGYRTINESIADPKINAFVQEVMRSSGIFLAKKYRFDHDEQEHYSAQILKRFANPFVVDRVERVGRDIVRKLSTHERITYPYLQALSLQTPHKPLLKALALVLHYDNPSDSQAQHLQQLLSANLQQGIAQVTGISDESVVQAIADAYHHVLSDLAIEPLASSYRLACGEGGQSSGGYLRSQGEQGGNDACL